MNKRYFLPLIIIITLLLTPVAHALVLLDSYPTSNYAGEYEIDDAHPSTTEESAYGFEYTPATNVTISAIEWYLSKSGSPTGLLYTEIYLATAGHVPTGSALARSTTVSAASLTTSITRTFFYFNTTNLYELNGTTAYCIVLIGGTETISSVNDINVGRGSVGLKIRYINGWTWSSPAEPIFYTYSWDADADPVIDTVVPVGSVTSDSFLINITVTDDNYLANLNYIDVQFNTTLDGQTATLRWTQSNSTFAEVVDASNLFTLNSGSVTSITEIQYLFSFNLSLALANADAGYAGIKVTVIDDDANSATYTDETFVVIPSSVWDDLFGAIDDLLQSFGVTQFFESFTLWIDLLATYLSDSITNVITLTTTLFSTIFGWASFLINWFVRIVTTITDILSIIRQLFSGGYEGIEIISELWSLLEFSNWLILLPILLIIFWIQSVDDRWRQGQGWLSTFLNDIAIVRDWVMWLVSIFLMIIDTLINFALGLIG